MDSSKNNLNIKSLESNREEYKDNNESVYYIYNIRLSH
jgi:hypothetical protein